MNCIKERFKEKHQSISPSDTVTSDAIRFIWDSQEKKTAMQPLLEIASKTISVSVCATVNCIKVQAGTSVNKPIRHCYQWSHLYHGRPPRKESGHVATIRDSQWNRKCMWVCVTSTTSSCMWLYSCVLFLCACVSLCVLVCVCVSVCACMRMCVSLWVRHCV